MKFKRGDIVDFKVPFFGDFYWLGGEITAIERDIGYTIKVMYDLANTEIGQSYIFHFTEEADMYEHDESRFTENDDTTEPQINFKQLSEKLWKEHDYVVAILPTKEEDAKLAYTLGVEDGFKEGVKFAKQKITELIINGDL